MSAIDPVLAEECRVFTRYLLRTQPSEYVVAKYVEAHTVSAAYRPDRKFDTWLVRVAGRGPRWAALADAFASMHERRGLLRRKLVLLLAILETSSPAYRALEPVERGATSTILLLVLRGSLAVMSIAVGTVMFLPARLLVGSSE